MSSAEPSTLLGLIQRGRGACFVAALERPALARDLVVDCIVCDPRWDHQVEQRDWLDRRPHGLSAPEHRVERESMERECVLRAAIEAKLISGPAGWETTLPAIATDLLRAHDFPLPVRLATRRCLARLSSPGALAWAREPKPAPWRQLRERSDFGGAGTYPRHGRGYDRGRS
ncbi:hypothetical protein [Nocardia sp. NPDC049526]|uniref:hypothetical protein n=1 Tax=Nocardia sp. NPDC049526 TaxID=3364316 RepID=UPI0037877D81